MKFLSLTLMALFLLSSGIVCASSLDFDARFDASGMAYNEAARAAALGSSNSRYYLKTARMDFQNSHNKIKFRARMVLNTTQGAVNARDSLNNTVDLFYVSYQLNDALEMTAGKFSSDMGASEHQYSSPDVYLFTEAHTGVSSNINTLTRSIYSAKTGRAISLFTWANTGLVKYYTGAKLGYKFGEQKVSLHTADLPADDLVGTNISQTRTMTGIVYQGSFMDKFLIPILSYHESFLPGATSGAADAKSIYTAAGLKINCCVHIFDVDFINNLFKSRTNVTARGPEDDQIETFSVSWSMDLGQWMPKLKFESSKLLAAGENIFDVTGYGAALEYKPVNEENFRFHIAYNGKSYRPTSGDTLEATEVLAGIRLKADILK